MESYVASQGLSVAWIVVVPSARLIVIPCEFDRMSDDVLTLTGQRPLSVQEFVRKMRATFTASAKAA
ncbi:MAG: hypothetical protein DMG89_06145 [Acidobacteria bacterium]|nr:MAG: hypothetical protein DMG89_06145 [Acidobacteriota bacterium]